MFCSWKSHPDAPCCCAYRLHHPVGEILDHLRHLGQGTLILRRPGLSLAVTTAFGPPLVRQATESPILHDSVSGLETQPFSNLATFLIRESPDRCPIIAIGAPENLIEFTVRLHQHTWQSAPIRQMIDRFQGIPLDCLQSRRLGAGAWLDEWEQSKIPALPSASPDIHETSEMLHRCQSLEVEIRTTAHRSQVRFHPSFIDSEGSVLRIADKTRSHILYADVREPGFHLGVDTSQTLRISHR